MICAHSTTQEDPSQVISFYAKIQFSRTLSFYSVNEEEHMCATERAVAEEDC